MVSVCRGRKLPLYVKRQLTQCCKISHVLAGLGGVHVANGTGHEQVTGL
jgi:hypothetical protein